jgi:hypothetical protein
VSLRTLKLGADFQQVVMLDPSNQLAQKGATRLRATLRAQGKEP